MPGLCFKLELKENKKKKLKEKEDVHLVVSLGYRLHNSGHHNLPDFDRLLFDTSTFVNLTVIVTYCIAQNEMKSVNCCTKFRSAHNASHFLLCVFTVLHIITNQHDSVEFMNAMANQRCS